MKLKKITIVAVELNGARIEGDENSIIFYDDDTKEEFELDWPEIWKLCIEKRGF